MPLLADPVTVLPEQREVLEQLVRTHSTPQQLAVRARMILHAADGTRVRASARELGVWPKTVRYWRKRWRQVAEEQPVSERLADAPRSGAPATYTPEQICAIVAMTCEKPSESERPISHWSQREIAPRPGAEHLAALSGAFFKKEADLKPHRFRYWLTPKPDPAFDTKCADICEVYKAAAGADDTHRTVSIDEMTGIQALERIAPGLPMVPGKVERREFEYRRHGTQALIAAFDVTTGKVEGMIGNTRTEKDFARFLRRLLRDGALNTRWDIVTISTSTCPSPLFAWLPATVVSRASSASKANRARLRPRSHARPSCASPAIASPSTSHPSTHHGSTKSKSGSPSWCENSFAAATSPPKRTCAPTSSASSPTSTQPRQSPSAGPMRENL